MQFHTKSSYSIDEVRESVTTKRHFGNTTSCWIWPHVNFWRDPEHSNGLRSISSRTWTGRNSRRIPVTFHPCIPWCSILVSVHETLLFREVTVVMVMSTSDTGFIVAFDIFIVTWACSVLRGEAALVVVWLKARLVCITAITIIPEVVRWHHNGASRRKGNLFEEFAEIIERNRWKCLFLFFEYNIFIFTLSFDSVSFVLLLKPEWYVWCKYEDLNSVENNQERGLSINNHKAIFSNSWWYIFRCWQTMCFDGRLLERYCKFCFNQWKETKAKDVFPEVMCM